LLSIPTASSIKRLVLENLSSLKFEPSINLIGITYTFTFKLNENYDSLLTILAAEMRSDP